MYTHTHTYVHTHTCTHTHMFTHTHTHICSHTRTHMYTHTHTHTGIPVVAQRVKNSTSILEDVGLIPGLAQWVKGSGVAMNCSIGHRCGLDLVLLWLWCRLAAAAPFRPLVWELPYATGAAIQKKKRDLLRNVRNVNNSFFRGEHVDQSVKSLNIISLDTHL